MTFHFSMEPLFVRDQHLESLRVFSSRLASALLTNGPIPEPELAKTLTGECLQCGMQVNGAELLQLAVPGDAEDTSKLGRLRFAYCGRKGCKSYFYKLKFFAHPQFDWTHILLLVDKTPEEKSEEEIAALQSLANTNIAIRRKFASRLCAGVAATGLLLLAFQWYNGGTIPLIRNPEQFTVDPIPELSLLKMKEEE